MPNSSLTSALAALVLAVGALAMPAPVTAGGHQQPVRFSTFNASLNRSVEGELAADLSTPDDQQAANVAEIIQRARPDVLLLNEFDFDADGRALSLFQDNYLSVPHNGAKPIRYPYRYAATSNTGIPSGHDLNNDGEVGGPDDAYGFGAFPGQYGMAVYSRYPIDEAGIRTFQLFRWQDMPGASLPDDWYSPEELADLRLSSKSHWDVPIRIGNRTVHLLASHPTPPTFDGPEDRNGLRNHDEIRFWADYVSRSRSRYIYDDAGRRGGLRPGAQFVVAGDLNADPYDGDSVPGAVSQLLGHRHRFVPASQGGTVASEQQGGANPDHRGDPRFDTADFADDEPGNLRVDYLLPSRGLTVRGGGVFWPTPDDPLYQVAGDASDHRLVWLDLK